MIKPWHAIALLLPLAIAGCDSGPYDPSAHRHTDSSTGSLLSGADTGANLNDRMADPSFAGHAGDGRTH